MWPWLRLPPVLFHARRTSPVVESTPNLEVHVALALLAQARAELRSLCLRKGWGEELRKAEERVQDAERRVSTIRRRLILEEELRNGERVQIRELDARR
jgi:hypothetical protein